MGHICNIVALSWSETKKLWDIELYLCQTHVEAQVHAHEHKQHTQTHTIVIVMERISLSYQGKTQDSKYDRGRRALRTDCAG